MNRYFFVTVTVFCTVGRWTFAAEKLRVAYVSPSISLSLPWVAKESGILAQYDLARRRSSRSPIRRSSCSCRGRPPRSAHCSSCDWPLAAISRRLISSNATCCS